MTTSAPAPGSSDSPDRELLRRYHVHGDVSAREELVGSQVKEREQHLSGPKAVVLLGDRLLDLHDQRGLGEDRVGVRRDLRAGGGVALVRDRGSGAGRRLDEDPMSGVDELANALGRGRHAMLLVLDLLRYAYSAGRR